MIGNVNVPGALAADIATVSSTANEALSKANQALEQGGGNIINITFANDFIGKTYTITNGTTETYTGTVPSTAQVSVSVLNTNTTYTVSSTIDGVTYSNTVSTGQYFSAYAVSLSVFSATITITAAPSAEVSATSGAQTYTATANSSGVATVTVKKSGTYTVTATKSNATSNSQSVSVTTDGGSYSTTVSFMTLTLTSPSESSITISKSGQTSITATSTGTDVFYIPVDGTWTVSISKSGDTATDTISISSYTNYNLDLSFLHIYGVQWDGSSSTTWTRTDEAASFTDPVPYIAGASSYGSPFDNLSPWKDMVKSTDANAGTVVAIPKFWYKISSYSNGMKIQIATKAQSGFSVCPACMDRGDGSGERDVVYIGRYHCDSTYKSTTGVKPAAKATRPSFRSSIHNLGSKIWQCDFAMRFTIWLLYLVEFANWNSQDKIGKGCGNGSSTENMGYTDSMPYHTGTTLSSRTSYGCSTQYRNIEGLWDNVYDWIDGCYYNSDGLNIILNPADFSDGSNGTLIGKPSFNNNGGTITKFNLASPSGGFSTFYPYSKASSSDYSTYSCDYWGFFSSVPCLYVGGNYSQDEGHGLFYVYCSSPSGAYDYHGSRLMVIP